MTRRLKRRSVARATSLLVIALVVIAYLGTPKLRAQEKDVVVRYRPGVAPIEIVSINVGTETHAPNKPFKGSEDWFKDLSVNIENTSGKNMTYIEVDITFMPPADSKKLLPFRYSIINGNRGAALRQKDSGISLEPPQDANASSHNPYEIRAANPDQEYVENRASLNRMDYPVIVNEIEIQIEEVIFSDGTMWSTGRWYRIDPNNPGKPIRLDKKGNGEKVVALSTDDEATDCYVPIIRYQFCNVFKSFVVYGPHILAAL